MIRRPSRQHDEVGQILDNCLDLISSGSMTVEAVIEQYPEHAESLRPPLEAAQWLRSRSEVFNPRPGFVKLSRRRLIDRFRGNHSKPRQSALETISRIPAFFQGHRVAIQYSALLTLTAVLLFVGYQSTSFLVQRSIPGDPLYKTKLAQENLSLSLSANEEQEVRLHIKFAQRRVIEMQELILVDKYWLLDETLKNFESQMAKAAEGILAIARTDELKAAEMSSLFDDTLTLPMNNLVGIVDTAPEMVSVEFIETLTVIATDIFDLEPFTAFVVVATVIPTDGFTFTTTPPAEAAFFVADELAYPTPTAPSYSSSVPSTGGQPSKPPIPGIDPTSTPTPEPTATPTEPPVIKGKPTDTPTPTPTPEDEGEGQGRDKPKKPKKPRPTPKHPNPHRPPRKNEK
jgi:hypothetical protein